MELNEIIVKYRKALGLTQEGLASQLGVTNQAVSKWESGQSCPDIALLPKIADLFGITIDALFGRETKQEAPKTELPWEDDGSLRVVLYAGHKRLDNGHPAADEISFCYEGPALNIYSEVNIRCDAVQGNVTAGGDVSCDNVMGHVTAGGDVNCDTVYGNLKAAGDVSCDDVSGSVQAQGDVNCDDVSGDVRAEGDVSCDCVKGDIHAGGDVDVEEASGNITAGGDVNCDNWER